MSFTRLNSFSKKPGDFPDVPSPSMTPTDIRSTWQTPLDELLSNVQSTVDTLNSTTSGSSGADNTGATGWTGVANTVQALLNWLKANKTDLTGDHKGTWQGFKPTQTDPGIQGQVDSNTSRLADIATDVKSFGAKGDGVNNDLTAINNAQTNANGKVFLPKGTFLINGNLSLTKSLIGNGQDTVIYLQNGRISIDADNIELANLKIHSYMNNPINVHGTSLSTWTNGATYTVGSQIVDQNNIYQCTTQGSGTSTSEPSGTLTVTYPDGYAWKYVGLVPRRSNIKIHDIYVEHDSSVTSNILSMDIYYTDNLKIYNNHFTKGGLSLVQALDFNIHDNYFDGLNANDNELTQCSMHSTGIIDRNLYCNSNTDPLDIYSSGEMCIITNNKFENINMGSGLAGVVIECKIVLRDPPYTAGSSDQPQYGRIQNTIIANNIISGINVSANGAYTGINCVYIDWRATPSYDLTKTTRNMIVKGNIIKDFDVNHNSSLTGITFNGIIYEGINGIITENNLHNIRDNGVGNWETSGIKLGLTSGSNVYTTYGCTVSNNFINTDASGIVCENVQNCTINANVIRKDEETGISPKYGIYITKNVQDTTFSNNVISTTASSSDAIQVLSSSTVVLRCTFQGNMLTSTSNNLSGMQFCSFIGNTFNTGVSLGISTVCYGNKFIGNHFKLPNTSTYGIAVDNQKGMIVTGNTFEGADYAVLIQDASNSCILQNNISKGQVGATFTRYLNVATADQSSCIDSNNILVA